ncbi:TPA: type IA DNA topoisomerase [Streptococcus suis]|nr:type IA DNA topoisomerase [Streptococcus suis]
MITVILAEKPDQAKKYAKALGQARWDNDCWRVTNSTYGELVIVSSVGHIVHMENPLKQYENWNLNNLPVFPKEFNYRISSGKRKVFSTIKREVDRADTVIIGTDPGREGEAIAYRILEKIPKAMSKVKWRLWCNSLSKQGIQKSFSQLLPARQTVNLYHEATARHISDWLVGYNLSPFTTIKMKKDGLLGKQDKAMSVGRVQTPIVNLIVENDDSISNFSSIAFYKVQLLDKENDLTFTNRDIFHTCEEADEVIKSLSTTARVAEVSIEIVEKSAPELFDLSELQAHMSKYFQWSADKTLAVAQQLYDKEVTSYPRTDYKTVTNFEFLYLNQPGYVERLATGIDMVGFEKKKETLSSRYVDDEQTGEHHAIIPTDTFPNQTEYFFDTDEIILYKEIARRTLLMFEGDYVYEKRKVILENNGHEFSTTGAQLVSKGWRKFVPSTRQLKFLSEEFEVGQAVEIEKTWIQDETKPPKRITEADLLSTILKKFRLGTAATRAEILKKIFERQYLVKDKKTGQLFPLDRGKKLIYFLKQFDIMYTNIETTKIWEETLVRIGRGEIQKEQFILQVKMAIAKQIEEVIHQERYKDLGSSYHSSS